MSNATQSLIEALFGDEADPAPAGTTIEEQLARGEQEIRSLELTEASTKFGIDLLHFAANKSRELGLTGQQFGNTFGYLADYHQKVDQQLRSNAQPQESVQ